MIDRNRPEPLTSSYIGSGFTESPAVTITDKGYIEPNQLTASYTEPTRLLARTMPDEITKIGRGHDDRPNTNNRLDDQQPARSPTETIWTR